MNRDSVTFLLHPAKNKSDVRPFSSVGGLYFDTFCYTDVRRILEEFNTKGIEIEDGPHFNDFFSEFTIKDNDGYHISFGE
jgi:hypothetical protein